MNTTQLKQIIKEAVREELKDLLVEAVKIASQPEEKITPVVREVKKPAPAPKPVLDPITSILEETKAGITAEDYKNIFGTGAPDINFTQTNLSATRPEDVGSVDLSLIPGLERMQTILEGAKEKDRIRHGI